MPVEKDIDLSKPITEEDIRQMEEEADRLEQLAQEAHANAESAEKLLDKEEQILNSAVKKIEQLEKEAIKAEKAKNKIGRSIKEVNQLALHRGALAGVGGDDPFAEGEQFGMGGMIPGAGDISGGRTGFGTGQERSATGGMQQRIQQLEAELLEAEKNRKNADKQSKKERAENTRRIAENRKELANMQSQVQEALSFSRNPMGAIMGKFRGAIGGAGMAGVLALFALAVAEQVMDLIEKQFAPGGRFDVRKMMLDRDREIEDLENIIDRRAGRVFFTSDVELKQGVVETSNTERLRDRMIRYQALHLGE